MARPALKVTKAMRERVTAAKALGMTEAKIALAMGISVSTLQRHFGHELGVGASQAQIEVRTALMRQAKRGNVSAQKFAIGMIDRANAAAEVSSPLPTESKPEALGKKDAATAAAHKAGDGSEWGNDLRVDRHQVN